MDMSEIRAQVRDLLQQLEFVPVAGGTRHAARLRFALARLDEQAHAAVMQSALYAPARLEAALAILREDAKRARQFLAASRPANRPEEADEQAMSVERAA